MRSLEEGCWKSIDKITRWQPILLHVPFCRAVEGATLSLTLISSIEGHFIDFSHGTEPVLNSCHYSIKSINNTLGSDSF